MARGRPSLSSFIEPPPPTKQTFNRSATTTHNPLLFPLSCSHTSFLYISFFLSPSLTLPSLSFLYCLSLSPPFLSPSLHLSKKTTQNNTKKQMVIDCRYLPNVNIVNATMDNIFPASKLVTSHPGLYCHAMDTTVRSSQASITLNCA